jgi:hypothetical protein
VKAIPDTAAFRIASGASQVSSHASVPILP